MRADRSKSAKIQRKADSKNGGQAKRNKSTSSLGSQKG